MIVIFRPYDILATSRTDGLIEAIPDTVSLHALKEKDPAFTTLKDFFIRFFGKETSTPFKCARGRFVASLAASSIVCFLLQIKDRHNGNILIHRDGRLMHFDFGFLLCQSPGHNFHFETAPFKLSEEFVELMGGRDSLTFLRFRRLCLRLYLVARQDSETLLLMVQMMMVGNASQVPCFSVLHHTEDVLDALRDRFKLSATTQECAVRDALVLLMLTFGAPKYLRCVLGFCQSACG